VSTPFDIRHLEPNHAPSLMALRRLAIESEPLAFGSSPSDDRLRSLEPVVHVLTNSDEQAVFGGFAAQQLIGMLGVVREPGLKERHKARLWGMFVAPEFRKRGVGTSLLQAAIGKARQWHEVDQLLLSVSEMSLAACTLYSKAGFSAWGREPRALNWNGRSVDELHLWLDLRKHSGAEQ
jgi:GNAT superfamily N-acetyltransferase